MGRPFGPLLLINRPPLGMWVWDVMSAAHWLKSQGFSQVQLAGVGEAGSVIAVLAAALTRDVDAVGFAGRRIDSLDAVVEAAEGPTPFWAYRLLWVADLPDLLEKLRVQGRLR